LIRYSSSYSRVERAIFITVLFHVLPAIKLHSEMMAQSPSSLRSTFFLTLTTCFVMTFLIVTSIAESAPLATASNLDTYCTGSHAWLSPGFSREHCLEAADRFQYSDYATYTTNRLEFSNRETQRTSRFPQMTTPRRYTISTCTIFVAMLWDFPNKPPLPPLPGADLHPGPFEKSQVTTFKELYNTAKTVIFSCYGLPRTPVGWQPAGQGGNIGVFVMATDSLVARNIPAVVYEEAGTLYLQNLTQPRGFSTVLV